MSDRIYWHDLGTKNAWHARDDEIRVRPFVHALCGHNAYDLSTETADRLPPTAHLCGNCSRIIAARTDIEPDRVSDVPEPTATEQDDWSPV